MSVDQGMRLREQALETLQELGFSETTARDGLQAAKHTMRALPKERRFDLMVELFGYRGGIPISYLLSELTDHDA